MATITDLILIPEDIQLRDNNPYSIGSIFVFPEGDYQLERQPLNYTKSIRDKYVTTTQGDTLGSIAFDEYGSSKYWWILYDTNELEYISPLLEVADGTTLLVPDLNKIKITN